MTIKRVFSSGFGTFEVGKIYTTLSTNATVTQITENSDNYTVSFDNGQIAVLPKDITMAYAEVEQYTEQITQPLDDQITTGIIK